MRRRFLVYFRFVLNLISMMPTLMIKGRATGGFDCHILKLAPCKGLRRKFSSLSSGSDRKRQRECCVILIFRPEMMNPMFYYTLMYHVYHTTYMYVTDDQMEAAWPWQRFSMAMCVETLY